MHSDDVRQLVKSRFPTLAAATAESLGEGWDFHAFLVDGRWVFRFPKSDESTARLRIEIRLLEYVAPRVPLPVPRYQFRGEPGEGFPYSFAGYPRLPGEPAMYAEVSPAALADPLGEFLDRLHSLDADCVAALGVTPCDEDRLSYVREGARSDLTNITAVLDDDLRRRCSRFLDDAGALPPDYAGPPRVLHNDLGDEHILVDPGAHRVTGIIDWTDAVIGDPALDFAPLYGWQGEAFLAAVLSRYHLPVDTHFADRVRYRAVCNAFGGVYFGLQTGQSAYCTSGLARLRRLLPP